MTPHNKKLIHETFMSIDRNLEWSHIELIEDIDVEGLCKENLRDMIET